MFLNFTEDTIMIERYDVNEEWAHCGIIKQAISVFSITV